VKPYDLFDGWVVVWRGSKPVAAFFSKPVAEEWISMAAHRSNDKLVIGTIYPPIRNYWRERKRAWRAARLVKVGGGVP
jgi:hypothetical protein